MGTFDSNEDCKILCPRLFEVIYDMIGLAKEQIHILMGPVMPFQMGHEGYMLN